MIEHKEFTDIPTCWNSSKVRYIYSITKAKMPTELLDNPEDGTEIYLSMDVIRKRNENLQYSHTGDLATEDDMLLLWDGSNAGEIIDKHPRGFAPSTTAILKNISSNNRRYCFYAMKYLERFIRSNTVGMGVPHVDGDYLKSLRFITPSNADQERLANYLDRKISVIDSILDSKDELINLLCEQRVGIISQAVTKGLYPDSAMKDCGVKWLGQVPAHWQVLTNHQLFAERNIKCTEPDAVLLSVTKHLGVILQSQAEELNLATVAPAETTEGYKVVHKGDLVMNIMRAKDGSYGISGYDGVISPAYCIYYPRQEVNPQYLYYLFKTPMYMEIFKNYSTGIAEHRMRLYPVNFFKIPAVVPPLEEQNEIVAYLDKRVKDIDELISLTQQQIEKLKEYRQSVISEVVTGKVAVE